MPAKNIIQLSEGAELLYWRGVLHEGKLERQALGRKMAQRRKCFKPLAFYMPQQLQDYPRLLQMKLEGLEYTRIVSGSEADRAPCLNRLNLMKIYSTSRTLISLVLHLKEVDHLDLKTDEAAKKSFEIIQSKLSNLVSFTKPYVIAIKRGGRHDGTHAHIVCTWEGVHLALRIFTAGLPASKGGGGLFSSELHACKVGGAAEDLERLASYLSRDADEGLHSADQNSEDFLRALERKVTQCAKAPPLVFYFPKHLKHFKRLN